MPKNKGKGGKNRRKGKGGGEPQKRELIFQEDGQDYGLVTKLLGNSNLEVEFPDGVKRICKIRGSMRKRIWIKVQDTVLVSLREFQDEKGDIIHVYDEDESRMLKSYGELPTGWGSSLARHDDTQGTEDSMSDDNVVFDIEDI